MYAKNKRSPHHTPERFAVLSEASGFALGYLLRTIEEQINTFCSQEGLSDYCLRRCPSGGFTTSNQG